MSKKLTRKQSRFVEEYLLDSNGKQAAVRAGYSAKTAHVIASHLLKNSRVKATLKAALEGRAQRLQVTSDWALKELIKKYQDLESIIALDKSDLFDVNGAPKPPHELPPIWRQKGVIHISEIETVVTKAEKGVVQIRRVNTKVTHPMVFVTEQRKLLELLMRYIPNPAESNQPIQLVVEYVKSKPKNDAQKWRDQDDDSRSR
jgi:phage terminase small subunit